MRSGDFGVELVAVGPGLMRETERGHVLARPGQVYAIRLRNFGPLRCVARISLDGRDVTEHGMVLAPYGTATLERPILEGERGRFTVVAEGDERVFGEDGGRDNEDLGLVEARFRRELPAPAPAPIDLAGEPFERPRPIPAEPTRPMAPPGWRPPMWTALDARALPSAEPPVPPAREPSIERAAGTGLTGRSEQRVEYHVVGRLEDEETIIRLRLVIGSESALEGDAPRPLPERAAPPRPAARP